MLPVLNSIAALSFAKSGRFAKSGLFLGCAAAAQVAFAQGAVQPGPPQSAVSQAVVQPIPSRNSLSLNTALARLGRDPRDVEALIDAGRAALAMGDVDAAVGFLNRADQVSPGNPRIKAGLASALVRSENPFEAIPLFDAAEKAGAMDSALAADRGLAYDLVGDNDTAQRLYRLAQTREYTDEVARRLALSQAISGDRAAAETTLAPLLQKQDKAAWRTRAFVMAIGGRPEEGVAIAQSTLPADLSAAISPYLRYMPRLTAAQQAAAANFGHFPRASEIGRDDPRIAQFAPVGVRRGALASADAGLVPKGEPLGRSANARTSRAAAARLARAEKASEKISTIKAVAAPARVSPPEPQPVRLAVVTPAKVATPIAVAAVARSVPPEPVPSRVEAPVAVVAQQTDASKPIAPVAKPPVDLVKLDTPVAAAPPVVAVKPPAVADTAAIKVAAVPASQPAIISPADRPSFAVLDSGAAAINAPSQKPALANMSSFDLKDVKSAEQVPPPAPAPLSSETVATETVPPEAAPVPAKTETLADAFSDLARPTLDLAPQEGAVDMRRLRPSRVPAKDDAATVGKTNAGKTPAAKPAPPSHPSRIWVQLATGRDKSALGFDWRRLSRQAAEPFRGKSAHVSAWGQSNRLLAGPFPSESAANSFMAQLKKAKIDGAFVWTSPAGQVVDDLVSR